MSIELSRSVLGRLVAHAAAPIVGVETAFDAGDWTTRAGLVASLSGGNLLLTAAGAASNFITRYTSLAVQTDVGVYAEVVGVSGGGFGAGIGARIEDVTTPGSWVQAHQPFGGVSAEGVREWAGSIIQEDNANQNRAVTQQQMLWVRDALADAAFPVHSTAHNLTGLGVTGAGRVGVWTSSGSAYTRTYGKFSAFRSWILRVTGVSGNWRARVKNGAGTILASADAVAGVADVDLFAARVIPTSGVRLEVYDIDTATVLGFIEPSERLWGGDVWAWVGDDVESEAAFEVGLVVSATPGTPEAEAPTGAVELTVYESDGTTIAWQASTDPAHAAPYLLPPEQYEAVEIDPVAGAATLATVEVRVIDPATVPGDQQSGWLTARLDGIRGRRCRLRRYGGPTLGWHLIADGPGGPPRLLESYAAYSWRIRDTREVERRLTAFGSNGRASIVPASPNPPAGFIPTGGAIDGFGFTDEHGWILEPVVPVTGLLALQTIGDFTLARVDFSALWNLIPDPQQTPQSLVIAKEGEELFAGRTLDTLVAYPDADVLWRLAGSEDPWNVARPALQAALVGLTPLVDVREGVVGSSTVVQRAMRSVILWMDEVAPAGLPETAGEAIEVIVRHRGPASEAFPAYYEGTMGELLADLYDGLLAGAPATGGDLYDPAALDATVELLAGGLRYDATAIAALDLPVHLRETAPVEDGRSWAEQRLYGPSGWIPALDLSGRISPASRARPATVTNPPLTNADVAPSADWNAGERTVSRVKYRFHRYFRPVFVGLFPPEIDGVAVKPIEITYLDAEAEAAEGAQVVEYDATAFSSIGDTAGNPIPGDVEMGSQLAQEARFEVLARYRAGAPAFRGLVRRTTFPLLRLGDWLPGELSWLPQRGNTVRGQDAAALQVIAITERNVAWREFLVEEAATIASPGFHSDLSKVEDEASAGYHSDLSLVSDVEGES